MNKPTPWEEEDIPLWDRDFVEGPRYWVHPSFSWERGLQHLSARWGSHDGHLHLYLLTWLKKIQTASGKGGGFIVSDFNFHKDNATYTQPHTHLKRESLEIDGFAPIKKVGNNIGKWIKEPFDKRFAVPQHKVIVCVYVCECFEWWVIYNTNYTSNPLPGTELPELTLCPFSSQNSKCQSSFIASVFSTRIYHLLTRHLLWISSLISLFLSGVKLLP